MRWRRFASGSRRASSPRSRAGGSRTNATGASRWKPGVGPTPPGTPPGVATGRQPSAAALLRRPAPVDGERGAADLVRGRAAEVDGHGPDLLGGDELERGLLLGKQLDPGLLLADTVPLGAGVDLLLHEARQHPARADRVAGHARAGRLEGDDLRQADDAVLGRDIGGLLDGGDLAVRRRDVDDAAPVRALHG